jgi:hypothetical protein
MNTPKDTRNGTYAYDVGTFLKIALYSIAPIPAAIKTAAEDTKMKT